MVTHIRVSITDKTLCGKSSGSSVSRDIIYDIDSGKVRQFPDCIIICSECASLNKTRPYIPVSFTKFWGRGRPNTTNNKPLKDKDND